MTEEPAAEDSADPSGHMASSSEQSSFTRFAKIVPIGAVHACDYVTDVMVVVSLFREGSTDLAAIGTGFITLSIIFSWIFLFLFLNNEGFKLSPLLTVLVILLTPLNLHVLFLGALWSARQIGDDAYFIIAILKVLETGVESVPLSLVTLASVGSAEASTGAMMLRLSSLSITLLSMAYGLYSGVVHIAQQEECKERMKGRKVQLFLCILLHLGYSLGSIGIALATVEALGAILGAVFGLAFLQAAVLASGFKSQQDLDAGKVALLIGFAPINVVADAMVACPLFAEAFEDQDELLHQIVHKLIPLSHRACLATLAVLGIVHVEDGGNRQLAAITLGVLGALDLFVCSPTLLHIVVGEKFWSFDPLGWLTQRVGRGASGRKVVSVNSSTAQPRNLTSGKRGVSTSDGVTNRSTIEQAVHDMSSLLSTQLASATASPKPTPDAYHDLHAAAKLVAQGELLGSSQEVTANALLAYKPSDDGSTESALLSQLKGSAAAPTGLWQRRFEAKKDMTHPFRITPVRAALSAALFTTIPSFFGPKPTGTSYELSRDAGGSRCSFFLSHSWRDSGTRKVRMLREFLCVQALLANLVVVGGIFSLVVLPLGLGIHEMAPDFPWWAPPAAVGSVVIALLLWVALACANVVPSSHAPWALLKTTLWLDKTGIDQSSPEMIASGVAGFERYLKGCNRMCALVSETYFSRLWCVYELATFCSMHKQELDDKLLLLSLSWPSSLSPFKRSGLSENELGWMQEFRCEKANCYVPADRAFVLAEIRQNWGSTEAFDRFVADELPKVMEASKLKFSQQLKTTALEAVELLFGD